MTKEDLLKVFQDKNWMDETIDLINDDKYIKKNDLDGDDEKLELIKKLQLQLKEALNKIELLETKKKKTKVIEDPTDEELEAELNKLLGK
jgi:hypothetical protein